MERPLDLGSLAVASNSPSPAVRSVHPVQPDSASYEDPRRNLQTGAIISKIEEILVANLDALNNTRVLTIPIRSRRTGRLQLVRFPSARDAEAKKFTALLQILHLSHEALVAGTVITKRAIYYQNPELFGSQRYVDELVDDIAFTFGSGRDALNIVATSKGLIAGAVGVTINNGSTLYCDPDDGQGVLLPDMRAISTINLAAIKWLLVIEKEATFCGLVASDFHKTATSGPGVLVTAKGYPDLSTRQFLHKVHTLYPMLPMYGLVDFDPDGVKIMLTYKNGSRSLQHEENATLNRLFWIGPKSSDILGDELLRSPAAQTNQPCVSSNLFSEQILRSQSNTSLCTARELNPVDTTLPLKATDRKLAVRLLSGTVGRDSQCTESADFVRELQIMLLLNTKAEIQAMDDAGDLTAWLDSALTRWNKYDL
ncbi:Spo11/DNA topoisomerase VI subunit A [Xylaria sp. FL0064]|nr:Spo11/DNA topoisomerase VI subunit A [Xylaria sp. FL0064]